MQTKLDVKVGDEVTVIGRHLERIVTVNHVTPAGLIDAGGKRWSAAGWDRGVKGSKWSTPEHLVRTTQAHRDPFERDALARACVKAFDAIGLLHACEVAMMTAEDIREATTLIEQLSPILAKRKQ